MKLIFVMALFASPQSFAQSSIDNGSVEQVTGYNNRAMAFGSQAEEWKKEWPLEAVRRNPGPQVSAKTIAYCLGGQKKGLELLNTGNQVSLDYEAYMKTPGNVNPGLTAAYRNQEKNLHDLHDEIKKRKEAAKCN